MAKMKYVVQLEEGDVLSDIFDELGNVYPKMTDNEKFDLAKRAMSELNDQGNGAVAYGLVLVGAKIAERLYEAEQKKNRAKRIK